MNDPILYILGNGFDLAHHLPTSYEDFHKWLVANREIHFVRAFERLYPEVRNNEGRWCDIESALSKLTLEDAVIFDKEYQECSDEIRHENSSHDAYICGDKLRQVIDVLPSCLHDWVYSINVTNCHKQYEIIKDAYFLSFNYTRTLEDVYDINPNMIYHVHGVVNSGKEFVFGYGEDSFEENECMINEIERNRDLIVKILRNNKKPVSTILKYPRYQELLKAISEVSSVIVYGQSCSDIDKPYFKSIADCVRHDAQWVFYVYDKEKNASIEKCAKSIVVKEQTFEITNVSPIKESLTKAI